MKIIIHGDDDLAIYKRLEILKKTFKLQEIIQISEDRELNDFISATSYMNMFNQPKLIICENFIKGKKLSSELINNVSANISVVLVENSILTKAQINKFKEKFSIEEFKYKSQIFKFLDNLSPNFKNTAKLLNALKQEEDQNLLWHLTNRFTLLFLVKNGISHSSAQLILGKKIYDWQWGKINSQATFFTSHALKNILDGLLKIELMIKSGTSNLDKKILTKFLLLKYLKS